MGERRGTKALETWCRRVTQGYPGVKVENMTTSWRDGLAFCALIHHFRPDLIDFARLDKSDVYGNNELAFRIAERHLGIPALLDAEDMAEYPVPDRLSILTYLSQFYQAFASNSSSPVKKASTDSPDGSLVSLVQGNVQPPPKMEWSARGREPCAVCKLPVFIAQRLRVEGRLYHRTCFRCARCGAQLSPADCYETCAGEFVCETCPDEMAAPEESTEPTPAIRMGSPTPPPSPSVPPPPAAPPEPPPSLVAMRRLMFDTDDAKLMKHDHAVNTTRIAHSIKKDLSTNVDSRSYIDKEEANSVNIDIDKSEDLPKNPEIDSSPKNSKRLDQCVNSSTIPASLSRPESARDSNAMKTGPCLIEGKDISVKLDINSSMEEPLDIRQDTLSFNDSLNITCEDNLTSHSESDLKIEPSEDVKTSNENEVKPEPSDDIKISNQNEVKPAVREKVGIHSCDSEIKSVDIDEQPSVSNEEVKNVSPKEEEKKVTSMKSEYPTDLNPFGGDSEEEEEDNKEPNTSRVSTNPFGSDSEEEEQPVVKPPPRSTPRKMSISMRSTASTNPFESDEEEDVEKPPVPLPRQSLQSSPEPTPFPRRSRLRTSARSITSLSSIGSYSSTSPRKKRPAPPPPTGQSATLSPSSRYSSVSSLNRPRKNKRAPLPPSSIQTSPSKTNDSTPDTSFVSEGHISIPQIEVVHPSETDEANAKNTGELAAQIEEGMKKLMAHNSNDAIHEPVQSTLYEESKSQSSPPSMDINSLPGISIENEPLPTAVSTESEPLPPVISKESESPLTGEDLSLAVIATKDSESPITSKEEKDTINKSSKAGVLFDEDDNLTKSAIDDESRDKMQADIHVNEENQNNKNVPKQKVELTDPTVNKEENIIDGEQYCDKLIENIEDTEHIKLEKTEELVETFNEVLISNSKNGSVIKFEEIDHPAHSTPVKTDISLSKLDTSFEDVHSGNSFFGTPYLSSPSASCADTSSYQESLSSPPTEKRYKDSANMHRKISESGVFHPHKSMYGQWKRKKAPAPPLPMPQKRSIKPMAIQRIRQELTDIEIKQQELERQGVSLEQKIRERFDSDTSITPYLEDLVLQLFELVNEKNELFRKQAELMYLRRQHQLEEEHAELEFQIRCLMARPEANKTDSDKELEEKLIQRLVEVVERRDAIVQCLEMDRLREVEEDKSINSQLDRFTRAIVTDERMKVKKKYKKKKEKHNTLKMMDLDKDFDESEKESKKKKRWYTLHHKMTKNL